MNGNKKITIFLVDDDTLFLKDLELEFTENTDFDVKTYVSGEQCIDNLNLSPNIVILDYNLDGVDKDAMNGIQTLDKIKTIDPHIMVVMLSSQDKIEVAVDCMHHQAFDYVVKSETAFVRLKKTISSILQYQKMKGELDWYMRKL